MSIKFSIIIPAFNEAEYLPQCLESIRSMDYPQETIEIIVVDNGSSDGTREIARSFGAVVLRDDQMNVSGLRNFGAKTAQGKILAFVDADCVVFKNWLGKAEKHIKNTELSAWGAPPLPPVDASWVQKAWYIVRKKERPVQYVDWLESMNLFVDKERFLKIGGFNEALVTCEDVDLSYRLAETGKILSDQAIGVFHLGEAETVPEFIKKEIWRGQSNLRGVFSHGIKLNEVPSLMIPVLFGVFIPLFYCISLLSGDPRYLVGAAICYLGPNLATFSKLRKKAPSLAEMAQLMMLMQAYYLARAIAIYK